MKEEGRTYQGCGFALVATVPWGPCGLHSKGRAGASGLDAHPCVGKLFRDSGQTADQNYGSGRGKGGGGSPSGDAEEGQKYNPVLFSFMSNVISDTTFTLRGASLDGWAPGGSTELQWTRGQRH